MKKYFKLATSDPKLFCIKICRRLRNAYKNTVGRIKTVLSSPKKHVFDIKSLQKFQLFDLEKTWAKTPLPQDIENLLNNKITIFGHTTKIDLDNPRWHDDLRLPETSNPQHSKSFSLGIKITASTSPDLHTFGYDVKYPWERSRLQHLIPLGQRYAQHPAEHENLFSLFKTEMNSWFSGNPFMQGVNWMNAMEVGIRASNMIWLFKFFCTEKTAQNDPVFWDLYINMLWQHSEFINSHWEDFDKPNNHYLLDLTGAWYLAMFFAHDNKYPFDALNILWNKICSGFNTQLQNDGTLYEGSTFYHRLIMQSLRHIELLVENTSHELPRNLTQKLRKGIQFLSDCTTKPNTLIQTGDNDSGFLTTPLDLSTLLDEHSAQKEQTNPAVFEYPNFGLIIITNKNWHISLRTRSYNEDSPRGHFHQDLLSITVSYQGVPFIVDSGTGCYTSNTNTRNLLRSWGAHSTIHQPHKETHELTNIFDLYGPVTEQQPTLIAGSTNAPTITAQYQTTAMRFTRSVKLNGENNTLLITDVAESMPTTTGVLEANLILAEETIARHNEDGTITLQKDAQKLVLEYSKERPDIILADISPSYGELARTTKLSAKLTTSHHGSLKLTPIK